MARCVLYNRTIDAVVISQQFHGNPRTNSDNVLLKIKGEPPDTYNDDTEADASRVSVEVYSKGNQNVPSGETPVKLNRSLHNKENEFAIGAGETEGNDESNKFKEKLLTRKRKHLAVESGTPRKRSRRETAGTCEIAPRKDKRRRTEGKKRSIENSDKNTAAGSMPCRTQKDAMNAQDSNDALFECDICSVTLETSEQLKDHKDMYAYMPSKYECSICPIRFNFRAFLIEHMRCFHANIPRSDFRRFKLKCDFCQKTFRSKVALQAHVFHNNHQNPENKELSLEDRREESSVLAASESSLSVSSADAASEKTSEKLNNQEKGLLSTPSKKMRQMVLTDFFATSPSSMKTEPISPERIRNVRKSSSSSPEPTIVYTTALVHRSATPDQDRNVPSTYTASSTPQRLIRSRSRMSRHRIADFSNRDKIRLNASTTRAKTKAVDHDSQIMIDRDAVSRATSTLSKNKSVEDKTSSILQTAATTSKQEEIKTEERIASKKFRRRHRSKKPTDNMLRRFYKCKELTILLERYHKNAINVNVTPDVTVSDITARAKNSSNVIEPSIKASSATEFNVNASNAIESNVNALNVTDPITDAPDVSVTDITAPDITQPTVNASGITQPNISAPDTTQPNIKTPDITQPIMSAPDTTQPNIKTPDITQPNISASVITEPNIDAPNVAVPNVRAPDIGQTVTTQSDITQPETAQSIIQTFDVAQPNINASDITRSNITSIGITQPNISTPVKTVPNVTTSVITARSVDSSDITVPSPPAQPQTPSQKTSNNINQEDAILKRIKVCLERLPPSKLPECIEKSKSPETEDKSGTIYKCEICDMDFNKRKKRRKHVKQAHTAYMSVLCKSRSDQKPKLVAHYLEKHSSSARTECCVCQQDFPTRHAMKRHLLVHCIKITTSQKGALVSYSEMRCDGSVKMYKCTACGKVFKMYSSLKLHRETCTLWEKMAENSGFSLITTPTKEGMVRERRRKKSISTAVDASDRTGTQLSSEKSVDEVSAENEIAGEKKTSPNLTLSASSTRCETDLVPASSSYLPENTVSTNVEIMNGTEVGNNVNQNERYPCALCRVQFKTMKNLWNHKRLYWASPIEVCSICGTSFPSKPFLRTHMVKTHMGAVIGDCRFHCRHCGQSFGTRRTLRMHEAHFHYQEQNSSAVNDAVSDRDQTWNFSTMCTTCYIIFADYDRLREHNSYYYGDHVFPCTFCDQSFQGMYLLHRHHKMVHYPEEVLKSYEFKCDICNEGFKTESHYFAHKAHVHWIRALPLANDLNGQKSQKADHQRVFVCPTCQLDFVTSEDLTLHEAEFSNQGSFACDKCKRQCHTLQALVAHRSLTHDDTDVTCYKCSTCNEGLLTRVKLLCHEKHFHQNRMVQTNCSQQVFEKINVPSLKNRSPEQQASTAAQSVRTGESVRQPTISVKKIEELTGSAPMNNDHCNSPKLQNEGLSIVGNGEQEVGTSPTKSPVKIKLVQCTVCSAFFNSMNSYRTHRERYATTGNLQCDFCPRRFTRPSIRREHINKHLLKTQWQHVCLICNEGFQNVRLLSMHLVHLHPAVSNQISQDNVQNSDIIQNASQPADLPEEEICDITFVATESEDLLSLNDEVLDDSTSQTATDPLIIDEQINHKDANHNPINHNTSNHNTMDNVTTTTTTTHCKSTDHRFIVSKIVSNHRTAITQSSTSGSNNHKTIYQKAADKKVVDQEAADQRAADQTAVDQTAADQTAADQTVVDQRAADKRVADQRAADERAADERAADERAADKRVADQRAADKRAADKRVADQRVADQRVADQRVADQRVADQRVADQRVADQRVADQRVADQRVADQRVADQRVAVQRVADQRAADKRAADQRAADKRVADQRVADQRAADQRAAHERVADQRAVDKRVADQRAADKRVADQRAADKRAADKRVADQRVADQGAADKRVADKRVAYKRVADKRAADKRVADQKAADQRVADQRAADKRAADKRAADQRAADQGAADQRAAGKRVADQRAVDQRAADERAADQRAADQRAADKRVADQRAADKRVADQKAVVKRAADQRVADQRAADKRVADQRAADERAADERAADKRAADQRDADQRVAYKRVADKRAADKRVADQKAADQRVADQRAADKRAADERAADQRAADQRAADKRVADQRAADKRVADQKAVVKRAADQRVADQRAADKRVADQRAADERAADERAADKRAADQRDADQRVAYKRVADKRAADKRVADQKAADQRVADQRAADKRAADERAADQRAADQGAADQRAAGKRVADQRAVDQRAADERAADQRAADQRAADKRVADQRAADKRVADQKAVVKRAADQRVADQRAADKRVADQRAADERAADERAADKRAADQRDADQRVADQRVADKRAADERVVDEKVADQRAADKRAADQRVADQRTADKRVAVKRAADQRVVDQRVADQRVADQRVADQRVVDQRAADKRAADQRVADQRVADQRAADERAADKRVADQRAADKRAADKRVADQRGADKRVADQRVADQRVADQRAADQRAADQRAADKRVADQRAADERAADERAADQRVADQRAADQRVADQKLAIRKDTDQKAAIQKPTVHKVAHNEAAVQMVLNLLASSKTATTTKYVNTDHKTVNQNTADPKTANPKIVDQISTKPKTTNQELIDRKTGDKTTDFKTTNHKTTHDRITDQPKGIPLICLDDSDDEDGEVAASITKKVLKEDTSLNEKYVTPESSELLELSCTFCPAKYQNVTELQTHIAVQHRDSNRQIVSWDGTSLPTQSIPCVLCNSRFSTQPAFEKHLLTVHLPCIRVVSNDPMKSSTTRVIYRLHKTSGPISYVPVTNNASSSSTSSNGVTPVASDPKLPIINSNKGTRIARLKVRTIVDIAANIPNDKKSPLPVVKKGKVIRLVKIKNSNNTSVSGQDNKIKNSLNVTPQN